MAVNPLEVVSDGLLSTGGRDSLTMASRGLLGGGVEEVTTSGGAHFYARPTQEAIDRWLAEELDPNIAVKAKVRKFSPQLETADPELFEDLVSARQAIEQFQRPLLPSEIEKIRDGFVSITDLLPDYNLDEMDEEAIVLLMMMRM